MTTEQYLNQLKTDKQSLVDNLVTKGVPATNEETFTTLVPKVLDISSGGSEDNLDIEFINDETTSSLYPNKAIFKKGKIYPSSPYDKFFVPGLFLETSGNFDAFKSGMFANIKEITLSPDITILGEGCFSGLRNLKNVNLENITNMKKRCFAECASLVLSEISDSVVLEDSVFYNCKKITLNKLPSATTTVGRNLFYGCSSITEFTINDGINIENAQYAFEDCSSLTNIKIPNDCTIIPSSFCNDCVLLENINLNDNIINLGSSSFYGCSKLTLNSLPSSLTSLGPNCFYNCSLLSISEIPKGVVSLPGDCFQGCTNITKLTILSDLKSISYSVFKNSGLTTLSLPNVSAVPTGGNAMFQGTPIDTGTGSIYVPDALVENFKSATNWSGYADVIKPISEMA